MIFLKQVKSQTPESVELEFILAGIGSRTLALIVDYLIWSIALIVVLVFWGLLLLQVVWLRPWFSAVRILILFGIYVGYFVGFETLWRGQTPGKRYAKIRVIRADGRNVGLQQSILRALLRPIDDLFCLGLLLIIFTPQEKRLGDMVAGTIVIQEAQPTSTQTFTPSSAAPALATQLLETAQIVALQPDEFAIVRNYLYRYPSLTPAAKIQVSDRLAQRLIEIIHLQNPPPNLDPHLLIESVYLAYQQQFRS
jgi:uncharacterized RDD family membrane protein YckC